MQLLPSRAIFLCNNHCICTLQTICSAVNVLKYHLYARISRREGKKCGPFQSIILLANKRVKSHQVFGSICCFLSFSISLTASSTEILVTDCFSSNAGPGALSRLYRDNNSKWASVQVSVLLILPITF